MCNRRGKAHREARERERCILDSLRDGVGERRRGFRLGAGPRWAPCNLEFLSSDNKGYMPKEFPRASRPARPSASLMPK